MRSQNRRFLNQPMKSPSPDVANRSIIANTKSPVNDVREYIKMRDNSHSPKGMTMSFNQISESLTKSGDQNQDMAKLRKYISELQGRNQYLERVREGYDRLQQINMRLEQENSALRMELSKRGGRNASSSPSPAAGITVLQTSGGHQQQHSPHKIVIPSPKSSVIGGGLDGGIQIVNSTSEYRPSPIREDHSPNHRPSSSSIPHGNDHILRQFNERILKMSEENKRLINKLKQLKDEKDVIELQNMRIKDELNYQKLSSKEHRNNNHMGSSSGSGMEQNHSSSLSPSSTITQEQVERIKRHFQQHMQNLSVHQQRLCESRVNQIQERLNRVQMQLQQIKRNRRRLTPHSSSSPYELKGNNTSMDTHDLSGFPNRDLRDQKEYSTSNFNSNSNRGGPQMVESQFTTSPSVIKTFTVQSPIRALEEQKNKVNIENRRLFERIKELQIELDRVERQCRRKESIQNNIVQNPREHIHDLPATGNANGNVDNTSTNNRENQYYEERIRILENQIQNLTSKLHLQQQSMRDLQSHLNDANAYIERQMPQFEKSINDWKEKSMFYEKELGLCEKSLEEYKRLYNGKIENDQEFERNNKEELKNCQIELKNVKNEYTMLISQLQRYLDQVVNIRYSLTDQDMNSCLSEIERKYEESMGGFDLLEKFKSEVGEMRADYERIVENLKKEILAKEAVIQELQFKNHMLSEESEQFRISASKLQQAIDQYRTPIKGSMMSQQRIQQSFLRHQQQQKGGKDKCRIRDYVSHTVGKISSLEKQISSAIGSQREVSSHLQTLPGIRMSNLGVQVDGREESVRLSNTFQENAKRY